MKNIILKMWGCMDAQEGETVKLGNRFEGRKLFIKKIKRTEELHGYQLTFIPLSKWKIIRFFQIKYLNAKKKFI